MASSTSPPEAASPNPARIVVPVVFAFFGALAPIGVALYQHRVRFLPIRTIEILWPSSLFFLPDPTRALPVLQSAASVALNAAIYAAAGYLLAYLIELIRPRASRR